VPVSLDQPLSARDIARFWSQELKGTPQYESRDDLLDRLERALINMEIRPASLSVALMEEAWRWKAIIVAELEQPDVLDAIRPEANKVFKRIPTVLIDRVEFLHWAHVQDFRPQPAFWGGTYEQYMEKRAKDAIAAARAAEYEAQNPLRPGEFRPSHPDDKRTFTRVRVYKRPRNLPPLFHQKVKSFPDWHPSAIA